MIAISSDPIPLQVDQNGNIRVGNTRVTLDILISLFHDGRSPEEIVHELTALHLADVYAVLGYYLNHQQELDAYFAEQQQEDEQTLVEIKTRWDQSGLRTRLQVRREQEAT